MMRTMILCLLLLVPIRPVVAQEDLTKDPRNRVEHFNPSFTLADDTLQWLMIHRLTGKLPAAAQPGLGKAQLAYEKSQRDFGEKHAREINEIVDSFGKVIRMPAPRRETLMRRFLALADHLPDAGLFQKQVLAELPADQAAGLIKLLRDRRQSRMCLMDLSEGIVDEIELPQAARDKINSASKSAIDKAYPYRSTIENIGQWVREQSELTAEEERGVRRLHDWSMHRRLQVVNEAMLSLRVDLPAGEFATFERFLLDNGSWRVQSLERIVQQQPAQPAPPDMPDVPADQRDPLLDPMQFNGMATVLRDRIEWFKIQVKNKSIPEDKLQKIDAMIEDYIRSARDFDREHRKQYEAIIDTHGKAAVTTKDQREKMMQALFAFHDHLPRIGQLNYDMMTIVTYTEGAPLVTLLRLRRQMRVALLELGVGIVKDLDVTPAAKARIEHELRGVAQRNMARRNVTAQLNLWRKEQPEPPADAREGLRTALRVLSQSNWLLQQMIEEVDVAIVTLQKELPAADFAKFEARATLIGATFTKSLDPKPKEPPAKAP